MKRDDLAALLGLAALWGGSFLFIRVAVPVLGPILVAEGRVLLGGLALVLYALLLRQQISWRSYWKQFLVLGFLNNVIPFTMISTAELHLTASLAAILNATTPLFAVLVSWVWLQERLTLARGLGVLLGLCGVAVLVGWSPLPLNTTTLLSVTTSLIAALSYALAGVYTRRTFTHTGTSPLTLSICQQLGAGIILLPLAVPTAVLAPPQHITLGVVWAMVALALLASSLAYLFYFRLIANVGATAALSVTFLVPIFGTLWSRIFLGEAIQLSMIIGMTIILASVGLVTGAVTFPERLVRRSVQEAEH